MQKEKQQIDSEGTSTGDPTTADVVAYNLAASFDDPTLQEECPLNTHWDAEKKRCVPD